MSETNEVPDIAHGDRSNKKNSRKNYMRKKRWDWKKEIEEAISLLYPGPANQAGIIEPNQPVRVGIDDVLFEVQGLVRDMRTPQDALDGVRFTGLAPNPVQINPQPQPPPAEVAGPALRQVGNAATRRRRRHECNHCGRIFNLRADLNRHDERVHGQRRHACSVRGCDRSFRHLQSLWRHLRNAHPELL